MGSNAASIPCPIFPPSKTAKLRDQITRFNQKDGESLYDAWERFKEMLRLCPHHGLETVEKALCDLGASVSLLPLSLFKRIGIGELKPSEMILKLADRSTIQIVGFVEDIPIKIEGIYTSPLILLLWTSRKTRMSL